MKKRIHNSIASIICYAINHPPIATCLSIANVRMKWIASIDLDIVAVRLRGLKRHILHIRYSRWLRRVKKTGNVKDLVNQLSLLNRFRTELVVNDALEESFRACCRASLQLSAL